MKFLVLLAFASTVQAQTPLDAEWPAYGRDAGGARFSPLTQITPARVSELAPLWTYHTGELDARYATDEETALEVTPLYVDGALYIGTPLGRVIALDPATGAELWAFDPEIDRTLGFGDFTNRGVSTWLDPEAPADAACRRRIYIAVIDARLIALDAATGRMCTVTPTSGLS